jgi:hypothetical protein
MRELGDLTMTIRQAHQRFIDREDVRLWLPIIATIVSITVWGMSVSNKIDLVAQKLDQHMEVTEITLKEHSGSINNLRLSLNDVWPNIYTFARELKIPVVRFSN